MMRALLLCVLLQSEIPPDPAKLIQQLMERIESLERRLAAFEPDDGEKRPAAPRPTPLELHERMHAPQDQANPPTQTEAVAEYPRLKMNGFTDFTFSASDQRGTRSGFNLGQFTMHFTSELSPRVNFFGEITFSARPDAGTGTPAATGFNAEVERGIVRFDHSDRFKLSFGRYHTPINYWNTAYHHGQWLQTSVNRPEMTQFGGRFIPVHFLGILAEGELPTGGLNLNYSLGVGNGRGSVISRGGDAGDANNNRAWLANLFVKPDRLYGLQLGGSVYNDKITLANGNNFREWITSAHLAWTRETPEIIAEFANVRHRAVGGSFISNSQAFYVQTGYRLPAFEQTLKPYYRFEYIHVPRTAPVLQGQVSNLEGSVVGLRYDLTTFAAFKFEYRNLRRAPGQPRINLGFFQTSLTF